MPISLVIILIVLIILAGYLFVYVQKKHTVGVNAPERKAAVTILDKQVVVTEDPTQEDEYWIYIQKGTFGPKREFQIGVHYYHHLNPGDKGELTYQGDKFLHFSLTR
ncbi:MULTISPECIES: DUF2500 domain-containing protein [Vibrio]|uniref:DUF2500 domain-containing protein n=1 Tax=Vibrio TaxID=662 RepID=UPI0001542EF6|nr:MULTISPECIES: DUF2500 domain-containing protein [Vibrio]EDL51670.1 hypothetical protein VSAK1_12365 [Vibrio mediterranei AK1]MCF4176720.1 DUF2500 domain-containing protein [Vibrio sp. McD22-P3]